MFVLAAVVLFPMTQRLRSVVFVEFLQGKKIGQHVAGTLLIISIPICAALEDFLPKKVSILAAVALFPIIPSVRCVATVDLL